MKFVREKIVPVIPDALEIVGGIPGAGAIGKIGEMLNDRKESNEQVKALAFEFEKYKLEWELEYTRLEMEIFKAEAEDRDSARSMRNEFTKRGKVDWFMIGFAVFALSVYAYMTWFLSWHEVPETNKEAFADMRTGARDVFILIAGFLFGSSAGSRRKTEAIERMSQR